MAGERIIGIDHGNGFIKGANCLFRSGIRHYGNEPTFSEHVLFYEDAYYVIGEQRRAYAPDKTENMDFYLLTLAAVAEELEARRYARKGSGLILACGLPIEFYGLQKEQFKNYLQKNRQVSFTYHGRDYQIYINRVDLFPQGFAAIAAKADHYRRGLHYIIDIGSGTVDVMKIQDGQPVISGCISLPCGIVTNCIADILKHFRMNYGMEPEDYSIQEILTGGGGSLPERQTEEVRKLIRAYCKRVLALLFQEGVRTDLYPCHFCCGGAKVFQLYGELKGSNITFDTDIHANAKGYEYLSANIKNRR